LKLLIVIAAVAALGAIVGTIVIGSRVREDTVVARPYEEGLRADADREARLRLRWTVEVAASPAAGAPLAFQVRDAGGAPLEGATVLVTATRPASGRGQLEATARSAGAPGAYAADLAFPGPGPWDVRFDVSRGEDRVRLTRGVAVASGAAPCALSAGPCRLDLGDGLAVTLELSPRPLRTMADLAARAEVTRGGAPVDGAAVALELAMAGMDMGPNRSALAGAGGGRYEGKAVLVRCPSGRKDWTARVTVAEPGRPERTATTRLELSE
jgi:nitrogen fixation protein FixH